MALARARQEGHYDDVVTSSDSDEDSVIKKLRVRVFTFDSTVHSFMVAGHRGGLTDSLGYVEVHPEVPLKSKFILPPHIQLPAQWSLYKVRSYIETTRDKGMLRRSVLFEEILEIIRSSQNQHKYPKEVRFLWPRS